MEEIPLNKYISVSGFSSRRHSVELIKQGKVSVNDKIVTEPGTRVTNKDVIKIGRKVIKPTVKKIYILLNKPKNVVTTTFDPEGRKTVIDLVSNIKEKIFPVGRLDFETTGLLILTNDGNLTQKLTHPKYEVRKKYEIKLDKDLPIADFKKVLEGVKVENYMIAADSLEYIEKNKKHLSIEIHSGKNRVIRKLFKALGYEVLELDRVAFGNISKSGLNTGEWRYIAEAEILNLTENIK